MCSGVQTNSASGVQLGSTQPTYIWSCRERPESVVFESHKVTAETAPYLEMVRLGLDSQLSPPNSGRIASASASFLMIGRSYAMCAGRNHADTLALTVSEGIDPLP